MEYLRQLRQNPSDRAKLYFGIAVVVSVIITFGAVRRLYKQSKMKEKSQIQIRNTKKLSPSTDLSK